MENDIAETEYQYLEETDHGNIVKGFEGFLHFRFSSQNRKTRVRARDRIFSRSSVTCPLPDEEDTPFATPPQALDALMAALSGKREMKATDMPVTPPDDKQLVSANPVMKRRRNTVAGSEPALTAPPTPALTKAEEPQTVGPAKRSTRRRK